MAVDRAWVEAEIIEGILNEDLDRLQRVLDYALANDDKDLAEDINGKLIKPHASKWKKAS